MSDPRDRWVKEHAHQNQYSCIAGFEADLANHDDMLNEAYEEMDQYARIELYTFVNKLLDEAMEGTR